MNISVASTAAKNKKAILWMISYAAAISGMHVCVRLVSEDMHPFQIVFFRNIFGLIAVIPWFIKLGTKPLRTNKFGMLLTRAIINTFAMLGFFMAVSIIPLAEVTTLTFTAPIFATLLAVLFFNERIGVWRAVAIIFGLAGTFVVLRPGFNEISFGQLIALGSAFSWAICIIVIKILGRTESSPTITTYMSLFMAPLTLFPALLVWTSPSLEQIMWLLLLGTLGGVGQLTLTESLRLGETHVVTPFDFTRLIFISILGYILFDQVPDIFVWVGSVMIIGSIAFIAWREHFHSLDKTNRKSNPMN